LRSEIYKLINFICNKEELPQQWKKSVILPVCEIGGETVCSNYSGISLLPTMYKIFLSQG